MTRARFLRLAGRVVGVAAAVPLLGACTAVEDVDRDVSRQLPPARRRRIAVIGAGFAGLGAARRLHDAGHDVVVLEARERVGGRVHSIELAGAQMELGANWIHGTDGNPLLPLLRSASVELADDDDSTAFVVDAAGRELSPTQLRRARAAARDLLGSAAARAERLDRDPSLGRMLAAGSTPDAATSLVLRSELQNEYAAEPAAMSAWWYDEGGTLGGDEPLVVGGFQFAAALLADGLDLRTSRRVRRIEARGSGVRVHATSGMTVDVDAVVVAVPIAVLAAGTIDVGLDVPDNVRSALDRIGTGTLEKVLLRFDSADWPSDAAVLATTDPRHVEAGFAEFTVVADQAGAASVIALAGGDAGENLARSGPRAMRSAAIAALESILGTGQVPEPLAWAASSWTTDPLARGSFSFLRPGGTPDDRELLGQVVDGRLVLAGEAFDVAEPATVHGALRSGRAAAARLLDALT